LTSVSNSFTFNSPGNYLRTKVYEVRDQYSNIWDYDGDSVAETYDIGTNGCNLTLVTGSASVNSVGRFQDQYGNYNGTSTIPACWSGYPNCVTESYQTIRIDNRASFAHAVNWGCSDVDVDR
jgi:hypothetical protein